MSSPELRPPKLPRSALGSRAIMRGAIGDLVDGRSKEARFLRQVETELLEQLGGEVGFAQRQLVRRAARLMLQLERLDGRMAAEAGANGIATSSGLTVALLEVLRGLGLPQSFMSPNR